MELLEKSPAGPTPNTVMSADFHFPINSVFNSDTFLLHRYAELLFGDCNSATLAHYITHYVNLPLVMLNSYIKALQIYRLRLEIWGLPDTGKPPQHWCETTANIVKEFCDNHDRELYTRRLVKLLRDNKTHRLFIWNWDSKPLQILFIIESIIRLVGLLTAGSWGPTSRQTNLLSVLERVFGSLVG